MTPPERIRALNERAVHKDGRYVVYWMNAQRRPTWNFALQRAAQAARELERPLVVLEALGVDYHWASDRLHDFVLAGMRDHAAHFEKKGVTYHPYVEPERGAGRGLHQAWAEEACLFVCDEFPCFHLPDWNRRVALSIPVRMEAVDSNGLLPLSATTAEHPTAYSFRRFLQRNLAPHLDAMPAPDPLGSMSWGAVKPPSAVTKKFPATDLSRVDLARLPIDHAVAPTSLRGGFRAGERVVQRFVKQRLTHYTERNRPDIPAASGLSPYLHFGFVSAHRVLAAVAESEGWAPGEITDQTSGKRHGWWNMSAAAEAFLDQLVTWRELGYHFCHHRPDHDRYESLPPWARSTLRDHAQDKRPASYTLEQFEAADTHDPLWNAAQTQLRREGLIHNYLRMLWGKKILHWTRSPEQALEVLIQLNNRWALDGRDPNSYSGIFWCLGRFDRAWGPEREIFGKVRYMTSENTARKYRVKPYIERYSAGVQKEISF